MKAKWSVLLLLVSILFLAACGDEEVTTPSSSSSDFEVTQYNGSTLSIVAGSENAELEPIIEAYAHENKQNISIEYLGSLDIMRLLQSGEVKYDAVWPASSIWLTLGDTHRMLNHSQTTSISPVVFGIKESLAEELGFKDKDVSIADIIEAIENDQLNFAMTSATQSNSGASAYIGFLTAIAGKEEGITSEDLADENVREQITTLLSGVNRSSGSSNWLVDLFLAGDYDAMVNYETLIIQTNIELEKQNEEPLYMVYPVDGLSISDSPLAYVDHNDDEMEEAFLSFQTYLLSDEAQNEIEKTGKRSAYGTIRPENETVFRSDWGVDIDRVLAPIRWPQSDVIMEALNLYQAEFKKPALTLYVLDFSGSMSGEGYDQMMAALEEVLIPENAQANLLLGTADDLTYIIPFGNEVLGVESAVGNSNELEALYKKAEGYPLSSSTYMYEGIIEALTIINQDYYPEGIKDYNPAIVVLTDGMPNGNKVFNDLKEVYNTFGMDVPVFSIMFGSASDSELSQIAQLTRARVFDGRTNLIEAFQQVKGYN
ncbi:substrate-binding and vWA domain-containing protein [Fundicoccus culcitae]|uniref:VWA domain-containing protein n=1 Tax=Fundicoccus culcitae TaxID=2969821 RepID=A0ABY5P3G4_9LACT|nr:VWA domain-containing protein [Fundicoccus culcitae]UUX32955.1 VWA domain-containing protein [Fundicoccus culcitae]